MSRGADEPQAQKPDPARRVHDAERAREPERHQACGRDAARHVQDIPRTVPRESQHNRVQQEAHDADADHDGLRERHRRGARKGPDTLVKEELSP